MAIFNAQLLVVCPKKARERETTFAENETTLFTILGANNPIDPDIGENNIVMKQRQDIQKREHSSSG